MDKYVEETFQQIHDLCHRIIGYLDAKAALKPKLWFVEDEPKVIPFPGNKNKPLSKSTEAVFVKETTKMSEGILQFTKKELAKMPKNFKNLFIAQKVVAHVRLKNAKYYEVRATINGDHISACSKDLDTAKFKFIEKLHSDRITKKKDPLFGKFADEWLENVCRPYVKESTYEDYWRLLYNHIYPVFHNKRLSEIDGLQIQKFINEKGASRTTGKLFTLLGTIFNYAIPNYLSYSPMLHVKKPYYLAEHNEPLSKEEEAAFIHKLFSTNNPYAYTFVVILYAGLRRSELKTAVFDENFITVKGAKQRKNHPEKIRRIPISPMLRKFMPLGDIPKVRDDTLSAVFKELCPEHTLHDLRRTFNVRARTCGIPKPLVQHWLGHAPSRDDVNEMHYMHYDDEYQLQEIQKFSYEYPDLQ